MSQKQEDEYGGGFVVVVLLVVDVALNVDDYFLCVVYCVFELELLDSGFILFEFRNVFLLATSQLFSSCL